MPPGALFLRFPFSPGGIDWSRGGMCMKRTVAVVGGDMRQVRLAELLLKPAAETSCRAVVVRSGG